MVLETSPTYNAQWTSASKSDVRLCGSSVVGSAPRVDRRMPPGMPWAAAAAGAADGEATGEAAGEAKGEAAGLAAGLADGLALTMAGEAAAAVVGFAAGGAEVAVGAPGATGAHASR